MAKAILREARNQDGRELLHQGLADYGCLDARQKQRFVNTFNGYLSAVMQGWVYQARAFRAGRPETRDIRTSNKVLREEGRA